MNTKFRALAKLAVVLRLIARYAGTLCTEDTYYSDPANVVLLSQEVFY